MATAPLTTEQQAEAAELADYIRAAVDAELVRMAETLVGKPTAELFGDTEFQMRDLALRVGAKAYQEFLARKKTASSAPASNAPPATKRRSSRTIGTRHP